MCAREHRDCPPASHHADFSLLPPTKPQPLSIDSSATPWASHRHTIVSAPLQCRNVVVVVVVAVPLLSLLSHTGCRISSCGLRSTFFFMEVTYRGNRNRLQNIRYNRSLQFLWFFLRLVYGVRLSVSEARRRLLELALFDSFGHFYLFIGGCLPSQPRHRSFVVLGSVTFGDFAVLRIVTLLTGVLVVAMSLLLKVRDKDWTVLRGWSWLTIRFPCFPHVCSVFGYLIYSRGVYNDRNGNRAGVCGGWARLN